MGHRFALGEPFPHKLVDPRVEDVNKALDVLPVFLDYVLTQAENIKGHGKLAAGSAERGAAPHSLSARFAGVGSF
jgi:hypothetical protein